MPETWLCPWCQKPAKTDAGLCDHIVTKHGMQIFEVTHSQMIAYRTPGKKKKAA